MDRRSEEWEKYTQGEERERGKDGARKQERDRKDKEKVSKTKELRTKEETNNKEMKRQE